MKTINEIKEIMIEQLSKWHEYDDKELFLEEFGYSNDDEWRSGLDRFFVDVQRTNFYRDLRKNNENQIFSDYSTDGGGDIKWIVDINGVKEIHWLSRKNNSGDVEDYIDMIAPYLYQMQVNCELEIDGMELYELLNDNAVIHDGIMDYVGWLNEPREEGDVICELENNGDRIEIVDGDKAVLRNGIITVKGVELRPLNVGKFDIPRRYNEKSNEIRMAK